MYTAAKSYFKGYVWVKTNFHILPPHPNLLRKASRTYLFISLLAPCRILAGLVQLVEGTSSAIIKWKHWKSSSSLSRRSTPAILHTSLCKIHHTEGMLLHRRTAQMVIKGFLWHKPTLQLWKGGCLKQLCFSHHTSLLTKGHNARQVSQEKVAEISAFATYWSPKYHSKWEKREELAFPDKTCARGPSVPASPGVPIFHSKNCTVCTAPTGRRDSKHSRAYQQRQNKGQATFSPLLLHLD